jgi:uncharacterized membrane protein YfcA
MELLIICIVSAAASLLTLFSGFGLGTILTPAFLFFFPVDISIALTGIVHLFSNLFKVGLLGRHAEWKIVLKFGIPSMIGAFIGAEALMLLNYLPPIADYSVAGNVYLIQPMNAVIAFVMVYFALAEVIPRLQQITPSRRWLPAGGLLSGFFGGLSGHQGALRSAFLIRYGLGKEQFLATGIIIACCVDLTRLSLYTNRILTSDALQHWQVIAGAVLSAFAGAYAGNALLKKVTVLFVQRMVAVMLMAIAIALGAGLI